MWLFIHAVKLCKLKGPQVKCLAVSEPETSHINMVFTSIGIPTLKVRRHHDFLVFAMESPIPGRKVFKLRQPYGELGSVDCVFIWHLFRTNAFLNLLGPSGTIWWHRSRPTLAWITGCCLPAPSHYLNQCWLIINKDQWHSSEGNVTKDTSAI